MSEQEFEKAEVMKERIHEATMLLDVLLESQYGCMDHVEEVLKVTGRLLSEAWELAEDIFPDRRLLAEDQVASLKSALCEAEQSILAA